MGVSRASLDSEKGGKTMQVNLAVTTKQETGGEGRASVSIKVLGAGPTGRANTRRRTCRGVVLR